MGRIDFRYDQATDIVIATPHWHIETEQDVRTWYEQYVAYMKRFNRKMDFVVVLDDFRIKPSVGALWGEHRARIHRDFTRFSFTVRSDSQARLFTKTSNVRYDVATQEAATVEDAIQGVLAARAAAAK